MSRMQKLGEKWSHYFSTGAWTLHSDPFWTYPHDFSLLKADDPDLYRSLSEASLVIFKGDLNYRKLVGDLAWSPTTSFEKSLQGFHPAPLVSLRTLVSCFYSGFWNFPPYFCQLDYIVEVSQNGCFEKKICIKFQKADVVVGLKEGQASKAQETDPEWMTNGNWGLIQFCDKIQL